MSKTQPARGMRDFLPADVRKRNYVINIIKEVYESYGFEPLETPAVENLETLTGKYGEEGNQLIFKILKRGEKLDLSGGKELADLALRYDLTVPLARVVAQHKNDLPKFFKRYQIQPVWRADRPARGRFREFYQCDVDAIGSDSMIVEAELCSAVSAILEKLGFDDFTIRVNHRNLLHAILDSVDIPNELQIEAITALDKLSKIGSEGVTSELLNRGIAPENCLKLLKFILSIYNRTEELLAENIKIFETGKKLLDEADSVREIHFIDDLVNQSVRLNEVILERTSGFINKNKQGELALNELRKFLQFQDSSERTKIRIDPTLARGLSYYTGAIFEIVLDKGDFQGSIGGGGRYDGLIGMFGKEQIPACGFSLGLERILVVMEERGMFRKLIDEGKLDLNAADVLIACFDENLTGECLKLAGELRGKDLRVSVFPEAKQNGKPYKYAEQIDAAFVCIVRENDEVTMKNMRTGEQETVLKTEVSSKINI